MEKIFITNKLFYDVYKIGKRTIYAPCEKLKNIQKSILELIKEHYNLKLSIQKAASIHTNQKWLLKMDIKSFYESVTPEQIKICIENIFKNLKEPLNVLRLRFSSIALLTVSFRPVVLLLHILQIWFYATLMKFCKITVKNVI